MAYYVGSFTEAKEHGWNLSTSGWTYPDPFDKSSGGGPTGSTDKLFSPDFIYHQINGGADNGSSLLVAASFIARIGNASWAAMPYDTTDHTSWPSEAAWREAGRYRGREVRNWYANYINYGYFVIYDDSDIELLKSIIAAGYCVSTAIYAGDGSGTDYGLYGLRDANDVINNATTVLAGPNHAQTIVGYKEGTAWNPANPDG